MARRWKWKWSEDGDVGCERMESGWRRKKARGLGREDVLLHHYVGLDGSVYDSIGRNKVVRVREVLLSKSITHQSSTLGCLDRSGPPSWSSVVAKNLADLIRTWHAQIGTCEL